MTQHVNRLARPITGAATLTACLMITTRRTTKKMAYGSSGNSSSNGQKRQRYRYDTTSQESHHAIELSSSPQKLSVCIPIPSNLELTANVTIQSRSRARAMPCSAGGQFSAVKIACQCIVQQSTALSRTISDIGVPLWCRHCPLARKAPHQSGTTAKTMFLIPV